MNENPHRPTVIDTFVVLDGSGLLSGRATVHVEMCPLTRTIVGFELAFDPHTSAAPGPVAVADCAPEGKSASPVADAWPLMGMPETLVVDCPELAAPTFRVALARVSAAGPGSEADRTS